MSEAARVAPERLEYPPGLPSHLPADALGGAYGLASLAE